MTQAGFAFEAIAPQVSELHTEQLSARELTIGNATRKAMAIAAHRPRAIVIGADTVVVLGSRVIGKPRNLGEARSILRRLSGRIHQVCTGVFIRAPGNRFVSFAEISDVQFRRLTEDEITAYIGKINPLDKAGAYAAQSDEESIIASIRGSFSNVVGLPMERTSAVLADFGVQPRFTGPAQARPATQFSGVRVPFLKPDTETTQ